MTLVEKAKKVVIRSRSRKKLDRTEYIETTLAYLQGDITLTQIQVAGGYTASDINSAYRIIAIGTRSAVEDGLLKVVEKKKRK